MIVDKKEHQYMIEDGEHKEDVIVSWIITHACQENCAYCISPQKCAEIMSKEEHFKIQNQLIDTGLTKNRYIGGEPLMVPHISNLIKSAYERGVNTRISTNGILLTKERFDDMKKLAVLQKVQGTTAVPYSVRAKIIAPILNKLIDTPTNEKDLIRAYHEEGKRIELEYEEL